MTEAVKTRSPGALPAPAPLRRRRSSRLLLLAAVLAGIGALLGVYAYRGATSRDGVVATAHPLPYGAVIQAGDLREAMLPSDTGLVTVAWRDLDSVVGRITSTDLRAGQTLTPDSITSQRSPAPGEAVVGLSVEAGRAPSAPLAVRDEVLVITGVDATPLRAEVLRAGDTDVAGRRSIDVLVAQVDAKELALASVDGRVAVVLVSRG